MDGRTAAAGRAYVRVAIHAACPPASPCDDLLASSRSDPSQFDMPAGDVAIGTHETRIIF
jgi:hypothetical protein